VKEERPSRLSNSSVRSLVFVIKTLDEAERLYGR
jgi:hypothetical protein